MEGYYQYFHTVIFSVLCRVGPTRLFRRHDNLCGKDEKQKHFYIQLSYS